MIKHMLPWKHFIADLDRKLPIPLEDDENDDCAAERDKKRFYTNAGGTIIGVQSEGEAIATAVLTAIFDGSLRSYDAHEMPFQQVPKAIDESYLDVGETNDWLRKKGYPFKWKPDSRSGHVSRTEAQRQAILRIFSELGHNPLQVPRPNGKAGVKAEVRKACLEDPSLFTRSSFDHAWKSLKKDGSIKDA